MSAFSAGRLPRVGVGFVPPGFPPTIGAHFTNSMFEEVFSKEISMPLSNLVCWVKRNVVT